MQLCFYFLPKLPNLTVENVDTHTQALLIMKKIAFFVLFLSSLSLLAPAQGFELYEPISSYQADLRTLERKYSMHESQEYYDRINQHYNDWLATIEKIDFDQLSYDGKMDYILFRNHILKSQFLQQLEEEAFQKVEFVTDFASDLYQFVSNRRRGGLVNGKDEASLFYQSTLAFREANEDLEVVMPFSSWMEADKAGDVIKSLRENVGASYLVRQVTGQWALQALRSVAPKCNLDQDIKIADDQRIEDGAIDAEVIYSGGGNFLALFRQEEAADAFARNLSLKALRDAPGFQLVIVRHP